MQIEPQPSFMKYGSAVQSLSIDDPSTIDFVELTERGQPILLKHLVRDWPVVKASLTSDIAAGEYLKDFDAGHPLTLYRAPPSTAGRFFYNNELTGFNFSTDLMPLDQLLSFLFTADANAPKDSVYVGSTDLDHYFPGFNKANMLPIGGLGNLERPILGSIWIGNQTTATTHFDISNNIACCVAGKRRFTLFPPDQITNLYPGPLDPTPAGQVVSMVNLAEPDLSRYPRFAAAMEQAIVAEMEPGDVLVYPAMWWHQVDALEPFNILVNYWWNAVPAHMDTPMNTLLHALLSLRDRPEYEKTAWRNLFEYYIFGDADLPREHLPPHIQGALAPLSDASLARRLRAKLLNMLNR